MKGCLTFIIIMLLIGIIVCLISTDFMILDILVVLGVVLFLPLIAIGGLFLIMFVVWLIIEILW
jgi:hypothetical protein